MKTFKNILLLVAFILVLSGINIGYANAATNSYNTQYECTYHHKNYNGDDDRRAIILTRKYTGNGVVDSIIEIDKGGNAGTSVDVWLSGSGDDNNYTYTTSCPKAVDLSYYEGITFLSAYSSDNTYNLKDSKKKGSEIYNTLPSCQYQSDVGDELSGDEYKLIYSPIFEIKSLSDGSQITTLKFSVQISKAVYSDGKFIWEVQNDKPGLKAGNEYTTSCPSFAHYNPPGWTHEYILSNSAGKPSGWTEDKLLERYIDFTNQIEQIEDIYSQFSSDYSNLRLYDCIYTYYDIEEGQNVCDYTYLTGDCATLSTTDALKKVKEYEDKIMAARDEATKNLEAIAVEGNTTIGDLDANSPAIYKELYNKYYEYEKYISNITSSLLDKVKCAQEDLKAKATTEEEKAQIDQAIAETEQAQAEVIERLEKIEAKLDIDNQSYDCSVLLDQELLNWIDSAFTLIQIGAVITVIVMGLFDFTKAVASSDADAMKKAWQKFIKRIMAVVVLLLLPFLIEFILGIADIPGLTNKNPLCK